MRITPLLFIALFLCGAASIFLMMCIPDVSRWWIVGLTALSLILLLLLLRSVILPGRTAMLGMELLSAQDFNNRLAEVGESNSDRIVSLFNTMIDRLRNERLYNLEQENLMRLIVDASPMGVVMLDYDGKIDMANESFLRMTGLRAEEVSGKNVGQLPSDLAVRMTEVPLGENMIIRRGDVRRYRCYHLSFVRTGFIRHFYLLESLTEEMMRAEKAAYEKVIRIMSHEVNNTMGGVRSLFETLASIIDDMEVRDVIESCDNRCGKMCDFISSYADVVRLPAPVCRRENLVKLVGGMLPFLRTMTGERVKLDFNAEEDVPDISVDATLIQQVIVNIVKNAVESIKDEGTVAVRLGKLDSKRVVLEISNNGTPITSEESEQLFSPFFTTKKEGRGLGLTLISEILNRHRAEYSLRSGPDGITSFRIELPR